MSVPSVPHIAVGDSEPVEVVVYKPTDVSAIVQNIGGKDVYVAEDPNPVADDSVSGNGVRLAPGDSISLDTAKAIWAICKSGEDTVVAIVRVRN